MITLSLVGIVWSVIGIVFVWMIVRYGISQGKEMDMAKEFEDKGREERIDRERELEREQEREREDQDRRAS